MHQAQSPMTPAQAALAMKRPISPSGPIPHPNTTPQQPPLICPPGFSVFDITLKMNDGKLIPIQIVALDYCAALTKLNAAAVDGVFGMPKEVRINCEGKIPARITAPDGKQVLMPNFKGEEGKAGQ